MDGWADSSGRMTLLWPHTAACLSVTLYLPASSAKYFRRGEGREKFITNQTTRKQKPMFWRRGKNYNQAFTKPPDQVGLFSVSKNTQIIPKGEQRHIHLTFSAP